MSNYNFKRITDPVHKTVGLSKLETNVVDSQAFQRLRLVKQLGLAYLAFPGADYSRFTHSLGVCHITGRILEALRDSGETIEDDEIRLYRLAALLHDVGHYPFSHSMEDAIKDHYSAGYIETDEESNTQETEDLMSLPKYFDHERVGQEILSEDSGLQEILQRESIDPEQIYRIFMRIDPPQFANLISSDLDADRIDYLLRTAHNAGLPYGSVDLDYLLSQIRVDNDRVDNENRICITSKALRTADHFLLSRYFDYQQVPFHKTVAAFELILEDVLKELLRRGLISVNASEVTIMIRNGSWYEFDDSVVLSEIRKLLLEDISDVMKTKVEAVLRRVPPKLLASTERIGPRGDPEAENFRLKRSIVESKVTEWSEKFGIDKNLWYVWPIHGKPLTKVGSHVSISSAMEGLDDDKDKYEQSIRVLRGATGSSDPIAALDNSLMHILSNQALYSLRVYALLPSEREYEAEEIGKAIQQDLPDIGWK